ncbi:histidine phosphatase family protein [Lysinibacillus fusiformis]
MTTFYLVRHGETQWNQEQRLQGWLDSPLTDNGREAYHKITAATTVNPICGSLL